VYLDLTKAGIKVLTVNTDKSATVASDFIKAKKITVPVLFDAGMKLQKTYAVTSVPTLLIVDKTGKIRAIYTEYPGGKKILTEAKRYK
jgi:peroxiredoxin